MRKETPCDYGNCPYQISVQYGCEYWCGEVEYDEDEDDFYGFTIPTAEDLAEYRADPYAAADALISGIKELPCSKCGGNEFEPVYVPAPFARFDSTCKSCGHVRYSLTD